MTLRFCADRGATLGGLGLWRVRLVVTGLQARESDGIMSAWLAAQS